MFAVQQALAASTLQDVMGVPAWKSHPSWFLVATDDQAIPPTPSVSSPSVWALPPSKSRPATWRWSPTLMRWRSSSKPLPKRSKPAASRLSATRHHAGLDSAMNKLLSLAITAHGDLDRCARSLPAGG